MNKRPFRPFLERLKAFSRSGSILDVSTGNPAYFNLTAKSDALVPEQTTFNFSLFTFNFSNPASQIQETSVPSARLSFKAKSKRSPNLIFGAMVSKTWVAPAGFLIRKMYPKGNFSTLPKAGK